MLDDTLIQRDPNTGLLRRLDFEYRLHQRLVGFAPGQPLSLIVISYDVELISIEEKLKLFLYHELRVIADAITKRSAPGYVIGKTGRNEFAVLAHLDEESAERYAQTLCSGISEDLSKDQRSGPETEKTVSIGVVTLDSMVELESAINEAERCMIAAKAMGRGQVCTMKMLHQQAIEAGMPLNLLCMEYKIRVQAEQTASDIAFQTRSTINNLMEKADTDPLTGLHNRGYFDKRMPREISDAHQKNKPLVYAIIDADDFGEINNQYDYVTGDAALRVVADVLRQETRSNDWVVRYGGEEFVVVMPDTELEHGVQVIDRIRKNISERSVPTKNNQNIQFTVSGGVIELSGDEDRVDKLTERVSDVVHEAKDQDGKNYVAYQDLKTSSEIQLVYKTEERNE
jgi:two-component system cell cycle response regulator